MPRPYGCEGSQPAEGHNTGAFEELLRMLRSEHSNLESFIAALKSENLSLREQLQSSGSESIVEAAPIWAPKVLPDGSAGSGQRSMSAKEMQLASHFTPSLWRHQVCLNRFSEPAVHIQGIHPAPPEPVLVQTRSPQVAFNVSEAEGMDSDGVRSIQYPLDAMSITTDGETIAAGEECEDDADENSASDDRRLVVCVQKLREILDVSQVKSSLAVEHVEDFFRRISRYSEELGPAIAQIFLRIRERDRRSFSASASMFEGTMSNSSRKSSRSKSKYSLMVPVQSLAELLLSDNAQEILAPCTDKMLEVLRVLRVHALQQDSLGLLNFAGPLGDLERGFQEAVFDKRLEIFMNTIIAANAVCIGAFAATEPEQNLNSWGPAQIADIIFTTIFFLEAIVKLQRQGLLRYCCGSDRLWNYFDLGIVALGIADFLLTLAVVSTGSFDASSFMVLKLLRLGRLLRIVRLSLFRKLKLMISGIVGLLKTLSCVMVILLVVIYLIATVLVQVFSASGTPGQAMLFSNVPRSMFTVFRCLNLNDCNAIDGSPIALHLSEEVGWPFTVGHCILSVMMNYGLGSLITALVVETTVSEAKKAELKASLSDSHRQQVAWNLHRLEQIFVEAQREEEQRWAGSTNETMSCMLFLGRKTFQAVVARPDVQKILDSLEVDAAERVDLFDALDADGNGYIEIDELVAGLVRMAGKASKADTVATRLKIDALQKRFTSAHAQILDGQSMIMDRFDALSFPFRSSEAGSGNL